MVFCWRYPPADGCTHVLWADGEVTSAKSDRLVYYDDAGAIINAHDFDTNTTLIVFTNCNGGHPPAIMDQLLRAYNLSGHLD